MKTFSALILFLLANLVSTAQTITKLTSNGISGTVCPVSATYYELSVPSNLTTCQINWSVTNGSKIEDPNDQRKITVVWNDTPGAMGTVTATFNDCGSDNEDNNGKTASLSELILSIKGQKWGTYGSLIDIDYCTNAPVNISVPRMFVQGTGGIGRVPQMEVVYTWELPEGWREASSLRREGIFGTETNYITIEPIGCAVPGSVTVYGTLVGSGPFCNSSEKSETATIRLNGVSPVVTIGPPPGYPGVSACVTNPVRITASVTPALGCINSYEWTYPESWSKVEQNANTITLRPSGTSADVGDIKATVNFGCGSSVESGAYKPSFVTPFISSPAEICDGGRTVTVNNIPPDVYITWGTTSNMVVASGQGSHSAVIRATGSNGHGTIYASPDCEMAALTKPVWAGRPKFAPNQIKGPSKLGINSFATFSIPVPEGNPTSYEWNAHGLKKESETISRGLVKLYLQATLTGLRTIDLRAYNSCGSTMTYHYVEVTRNGGGGGGGGGGGVCDDAGLAIFPNPAGNDRVMHVVPLPCKPTPCPLCDLMSVPEPPSSERITPFNYAIYDLSNNRLLSGTSSDQLLDVRSLASGTYILRVEHEGNAYSEHIVIE